MRSLVRIFIEKERSPDIIAGRLSGTYTEITLNGITPELPINGGLTMQLLTLLSRVHNAS